MDTLGPDNSRIPSHLKEAGTDPERESRLQEARRRVKSAVDAVISKQPEEELFDTPATVRPISEAPSRRRERAAAEAIESAKAERLEQARAALEDRPVPVTAEGNVVDMAKYRRVEAARTAVDEAYETLPKPEPSQIEDLFQP